MKIVNIVIIAIIFLVVWFLSGKQKKQIVKNNMIKDIDTDKIRRIYTRGLKEDHDDKDQNLKQFFFSISEFYYYNPNAYNEMLDSIDIYLRLFDEAQKQPSVSGLNFESMETYKRNALNSLSSIIYNLPEEPRLLKKLKRSINKLEDILLVFQNSVYYIYSKHVYDVGYNTKTKLLHTGPKPINSFQIDSNAGNINDKYSYSVF